MPYVIHTTSYDEENDSYEDISFVTDCYGVQSITSEDPNASAYYIDAFVGDDDIDISQLIPLTADEISSLPADTDSTEIVTDDAFDVDELNASIVNTNSLIAITGKIVNASVEIADIETLNAEVAKVKSIYAVSANVDDLYAIKASVSDLDAANASINSLSVDVAEIKQLNVATIASDVAKVKELITDFATIDTAKVKLLTSDEILTEDITAVTISATKYLTGVTIVGDVIKANTLTADKLLLKGADGLYYAINAGTGSLTADQLTDEAYQNAIDGSALVAKSVTADRIDVTDLFAQEVTATNLTISENSRLHGVSATNLIVSGDSVFSGKIVGKAIDISALDPDSGLTCGIRSSDGRVRINMLYGTNSGAAGIPTVGDTVAIHNSVTGKDVRVVVTSVTPNSNGNSYSVEALENGYRTWWFSIDSSGNQFGGISYETQGGYYDETTGETTTEEFGYIAGTISAPNGWGATGEAYIEVSEGTVDVVSDAVNIVATDIALTADSIKAYGGLTVAGGIGVSGNVVAENDLTVAGKVNGCTIRDLNTVGGTFVYGGSVVVDTSSNGQTWSAAHPSYVGSIKDNGAWYNYISVRHQNGNGDGNAYGMRFWSPLHSQGDLRWQQQVNSWGTAKVIIDNSNISTYLPTGAPGTKGGAQFASGGINVGSVSSGGYKDYSHTFSGTFGGTPNVVVCTYESSAGTSASGNVARKAIVTKRSSTGFTVRLYNNSSSTWSPYVEYIAIYKG